MNAPETCPTCAGPFVSHGGTSTTLVAFSSPEGHNHDDNCRGRTYFCAAGHETPVWLRNRCPAAGCDWRGKEACFCHEGAKVDAWPPDVPLLPPQPGDPLRLPTVYMLWKGDP